MNSRTFNAWLQVLGYQWVGHEMMVKGFMNKSEAETLIGIYESEGVLKRG